MNRLLVTGLALGRDFGKCQVCYFDLSWLVNYPSTLLWADRILLTPTMWDTVAAGQISPSPALSKSTQLLFEFCQTEKIFERFDPTPLITEAISETIYSQIDRDRQDLVRLFPDRAKIGDESHVPGQIFVDGSEYCTPYLWSIYAGLFLAHVLDAQCLFNDPVLNYCRYKFGLSSPAKVADPALLQSFSNIFDAYVPNPAVFPTYALENADKCSTCAKEDDCSKTYLDALVGNLKQIVKWREYDEICQLKEVISSIVARQKELGLLIKPSEVSREFDDRQRTLRKRLHHVFPRVDRWANVTTVLSIPVAIAGIATGDPGVTIGGTALAGIATGTKEVLKYLRNKYNWLGFTSKNAPVRVE